MASKVNRKRNAERKLLQAHEENLKRCGASKRNGLPCRREAGWGTSHPGWGHCKHHSGASPTGEVGARAQEINGLARPLVMTPGQAMIGVLHLAAGQVQYVTEQVAALGEDEIWVKRDYEVLHRAVYAEDGETILEEEVGTYKLVPHAWVALQQAKMDALMRYSKLAAEAGIAERAQELAEYQTRMVQELFEKVAGDLSLTAEQRQLLGPSIRRNLTLVQGGKEEEAA